MKKSLVALAALAVATGALADVSITGTLSGGYYASSNWTRDVSKDKVDPNNGKIISSVGNDSSGFGIDKAQINIKANSKIDASQEIIAKMSIMGADRSMSDGYTPNKPAGTAVQGGDASLAYINQHFGMIELGNSKAPDFFSGIASAGAPTFDWDNKLFQQRSSNDYISYTVPVGPVYFILTHNEDSSGLGVGKGETGGGNLAINAQRNNQITAYYKQHNVEAALTYRVYDNRKESGTDYMVTVPGVGAIPIDGAFLGTRNDVTNFQANYDFGFAKLGYGAQLSNATNGTKILDSLIGISAPVGNWTLGATFAIENGWGVPDTSAKKIGGIVPWNLQDYQGATTGYSVGAAYNFSKQTQLLLRYSSWNASGYNRYQNDSANMANAMSYIIGGGHGSLNGLGGMGIGTATLAGITLVHNF